MWYNKIVKDLGEIPNAVQYYESELNFGKNETKIIGSLEKSAQDLSGITSYRFNQLQEIEAILKYLIIQRDRMHSVHYRKYTEAYARTLSDRSIEKYINGEDDIVSMETLINDISLVRNRYLAHMKGLDVKQFQLSNIVKLRISGMETVTLENNTRF